MWIKEEFGNSPKIIIAPGYWPNGVFPAYLGWAMVFLNIDMKSSFIYIGQLYDLLTGKPSAPFYGFPSNPLVIQDPQKYHIIILNYADPALNFYTPDPLELLILKDLRPNVYEVDFANVSKITQWCRLWVSINADQLPEGEIGYADSSFMNWTANQGYLITSKNEASFVLWKNATEGWVEVKNLNLNYSIYPYMFLKVNTLGGKIGYVDFYDSQNKLIGRGNPILISNFTVFLLNLQTLELPYGDSIFRIAIVFDSVNGSNTFLIDWVLFIRLT
jgi:hypothetical protein